MFPFYRNLAKKTRLYKCFVHIIQKFITKINSEMNTSRNLFFIVNDYAILL